MQIIRHWSQLANFIRRAYRILQDQTGFHWISEQDKRLCCMSVLHQQGFVEEATVYNMFTEQWLMTVKQRILSLLIPLTFVISCRPQIPQLDAITAVHSGTIQYTLATHRGNRISSNLQCINSKSGHRTWQPVMTSPIQETCPDISKIKNIVTMADYLGLKVWSSTWAGQHLTTSPRGWCVKFILKRIAVNSNSMGQWMLSWYPLSGQMCPHGFLQ